MYGNSNQDPRVRRTERLLQVTLQTLLTEKRFDQITVSEIVKRAEVARTTFYAHFETKEQLLLSLYEEIKVAPQAELDAQISQGTIDLRALALVLFRSMKKAEPLFQALKDPNLELVVSAITKGLIKRAILQIHDFEDLSEWELQPYLDDVIAGVLFSLTHRWVQGGMVISTEAIAKLFAEYALLTRKIGLGRFS